MPWSGLSPVELRKRFLAEAQSGERAFVEVCRQYGVSRKTGYKWLKRFRDGGIPALIDRAPIANAPPHALAPEVEMLIIWARLYKPSWGPKKLRILLEEGLADLGLPAASTIGDVLKRHGLIEPSTRRRRRHLVPYPFPMRPASAANDVWTADFKGDFKLRDGRRCYPFTLEDFHTRFLLRCDAMRATLRDEVQSALLRAFEEYGLPGVIRTDNGVPFVGTSALAGLSELSVWLLRLGVWVERTRKGSPQDNGRHERMHRTMKAEACNPPQRNLCTQQHALDAFRLEYNEERPHEALAFRTPAQLYEPSLRPMPRRLPELHYEVDVEVRRVSDGGFFKWRKQCVFLTKSLRGQDIGLTTVDGRNWLIRFGEMPLARFNEETGEIQEVPRLDGGLKAA